MDYEKRLNAMMLEVCNDFSKEKYAEFTRCLAVTMSEAFALIRDKEEMGEAMMMLFSCIALSASEQWDVLHGQTGGALTAEDFLRDVFNPSEKND